MSNTVIKVENVGKQYRLGQVGTGTISHDLNRWWSRVRGKEDPYLKIGEANDRSVKGESDLVWALRDINFEVQQGEVLGIIGKNGAGKSTLLKILSRVTGPTVGELKAKGRIASLLEVGTGFHPELTGRENIFLNGAILGMTKQEIRSKFDEIVAFSGVERYIDTPVKRYSSGMYVRLAFAVAAHLEPEILIIDEVLAVGDAEFQKKCLGKMKDISGQGRTVLFVSHDMSAIKSLCHNALFLKNGTIYQRGNASDIVDSYLNEGIKTSDTGLIPDNASLWNTGEMKFRSVKVLNNENRNISTLYYGQPFSVELEVEVNINTPETILDLAIGNFDKRIVYTSSFGREQKPIAMDKGYHRFKIDITNNLLPGNYTLFLGAHDVSTSVKTMDFVERVVDFNVLKVSEDNSEKYPFDVTFGFVNQNTVWQHEKIKTD